MLRIALALGLFALGFLPVLAADAEPEEFTSKAGKYKATFPAKVETKETPKKDKQFATYTATAQPKLGHVFTITYFDFDIDIPANMQKEFIAAISSGVKGKVVTDKETTFGKDKLPARETLYELPKVFLRQLIILDGRRVYQVIVAAATKADVTSKEADKFIKSFQIVK